MTTTASTNEVATQERSLSDRMHSAREWLEAAGPDSSFAFTIAAIVGILVLGVIVVPLSIPDAPPVPSKAHVLGEQYLMAFSAPGSPTLAAQLPSPSIGEVVKSYGATGGTACAGSQADAYDALLDGGSFDKAGFAKMRVAQGVYCPDRAATFPAYVIQQNAARRAQLDASAAADSGVTSDSE